VLLFQMRLLGFLPCHHLPRVLQRIISNRNGGSWIFYALAIVPELPEVGIISKRPIDK
jgi:hypothetical protein